MRVGWRPNDAFYIGGAYEISKQDPDQLYRLGILQQLRAEGRRYFPTGREVTPFLLVGRGRRAATATSGRVDTWGPTATLGGGIEVELGGPVLLRLGRLPAHVLPLLGRSRRATTSQSGVVHFVGLDIAVEAKDRSEVAEAGVPWRPYLDCCAGARGCPIAWA